MKFRRGLDPQQRLFQAKYKVDNEDGTHDIEVGGTTYTDVVGLDGVNGIPDTGCWIQDMGKGRWLLVGTTGTPSPTSGSTTGVTMATNWTKSDFQWRRHGPMLTFRLTGNRTTSSISLGTNGNCTNTLVATLDSEFRNAATTWYQPLSTVTNGRGIWGSYKANSGSIHFNAMAGTGAFGSTEQFELGGTVMIG